MFHWDDGLFLSRPRLALDVRRRQPAAFVSHAHSDHIGPHQLAYCTRETALLYQHKLGTHRQTKPMAYGEPLGFGSASLTAYPAGHCLGSAMLLAETDEGSLLYTGDFKLGPSATAVEAELPRADILVMECTFGSPRYRLPPREETITQLVALVQSILADGATPVVHAYALGKSQEATRLLTDAGIPVLQHPEIFAISEIYRQCGVELGDCQPFHRDMIEGRAVVTWPKSSPRFRLPGIEQSVSIAVTGWAADSSTKYRWKVDHAIPLSDHADYDQLLETVERVGAQRIYCTHGPRKFVDCLLAAGYPARHVDGAYQSRLF